MLSLVVARARAGAIGRDNEIPWRAPEDLAFFRRETTGGAVIMGRRTWESLPAAARPLKDRLNIVVSSGQPEGASQVVPGIDAALAAARDAGHARVYGIGGERIYAALLPRADRLLITEVACDVAGADAFFPDVPTADWTLAARLELRATGPCCVLHEYLRRRG